MKYTAKRFLAMLLAVLMVAGMLPAQVLAEELAPVIQEDNVVPTEGPTEQPTEKPTETATGAPTDGATETPTDGATEAPTDAAPTDAPTEAPATEAPTEAPTEEPTEEPTEDPKSRAADAENYLILSEDYTSLGTWTIVSADAKDDWHNLHLKGKTNENTTGNEPAVATINVETAGTYYLWVNTKPYLNTPAKRHFEIDINGTQTAEKYGTEAGADDSQPYEWYGPVEVTLNAGSNTVKAVDTSSYYAHLNGILLTSAPSLDPNGMTYDEIEAVSVRNTPEVEVTSENYLILSDSYDTLGNWTVVQADAKDDWNNAHLKGGEDRADHSATPAVATIDDVTAGTYYLWVNDKQFNTADYTTRFFNLEVNGTELSHTFGQVKPAATGYYWEGPFEVTLNDGTNTIKVLDTSGWWANLNGILLTDNAELNPAEKTYAQIEAMSTKKTVVPAEPEVDEMEDVTVSTDHPGGGVLLQSKQDGVITFTTDMTGHDYSSGNWFYWNFKVTSETDRTVTFKTNARYLGDSGPVYSADGENWDYLCPKNSSGTFTYDLKANEPVYFSCTLPYQYADMLEWLEELESKNSSRNGLVSVDYDFAQTGHETFTAAQIAAGEANPHIGGGYYDIPMITLGSTSAPKYLYFSGRMHACETMGSYTLEGVIDYFAALSADDPFWDEYCIYVIPMIDVEGVENGDQGKSRNLTDLDASSAVDHDHNRDWTDGEEVFNYTKAAKAFVAERKTAGQQLELYIDFHCPYLNGYAGNYISYGLWNEEEVMLFSDILEEIVAADTRENKLTYDYDKGQNAWSQQASQEPAVSKTWFYNQGAVATFSFETLFTEKSPAYYAENVHQLGENIAKTTLQFLNEVHKSGENDITSFKIGETAGAIESGKTIGQVDMYYNDTSSVKEWSNLGTIDLEANVPVVLDFTAVGQSEGATGKFRLAATAVRLTDSEGNVTEIAAKDCFTANGNATQNNCRDDGLWMTQNYTSSGGTGDPTGCSVLITVEAPKTDTYTIEIYTWSNQDGGIYELTDSRNYITVALGEDADVTDVTPTVTVSDKATYAPTGAQDFSKGAVKYTVTAENGDTKDYFVTVTGGNGGTVTPDPEPTEPDPTEPESTEPEQEYEQYLILPDSFDSLGTWTVMEDSGLTDWNDLRLMGAMETKPAAAKPAVATIDVETAGTYYLWVNCKHFLASQEPERRYFNISVNDTQVDKTYGQVQVTGSAAAYEWEGPVEVTLTAGTNTVKALDTSLDWPNIGGILLTNNADLNPATLSYKDVLDISVKKTVTPSEPEVDNMEDVTIDTAFPGGGVIVVSKEENVITLDQDLSQSIPEEYHWFYWNFKVTSQSDRLVKFNFAWARSIGDGGVLYSTDGDKTWNYLGRTNGSHQYFTYQLKAGETVHFACALPYQYADLQAWLQELETLNSSLISVDYDFAQTGFETFTQEQIDAGLANPNNGGKVYDIPMITLGNPDAPKYLFFTARMHACETVASFVLEGVVNDFAKIPADDPFWEEYCIYVVPMMDVEGVENGDQGKNRAPHDHNRDWAEGEEIYNVTKAVKAFVADLTAAGKKLDVFIDFHCPYLYDWAGNYLAYGDWNVDEIKAFADILEKTVAADTSADKIGFDFDDVNSYSQNITGDPTKPDAKNWFYKQGAIMTCSLETLFTETDLLYKEDNLHQWGSNIAESLREFLVQANKSDENQITSFKIGEAAGTIENGRTIGQVDMYLNSATSAKEWRELGSIVLEANVPVVLDFTAVGQSADGNGIYRLAAEKVRLTDSAGNATEIAVRDCFTANGNADQNSMNGADSTLWLTQNYGNKIGTTTGCSVLVTLEAAKTDTYKIEMYLWSNQDGGIYKLTDPRNFITVEVDENTDTTSLTPTVTVSDKATYTPAGAQDFSKGAIPYAVTAENGKTNTYIVTVTGGKAVEPAPETADKTALQSAVTAAGSYAESGYTADSWSIFSAALTAAQAVLDDQDAAQTEVDDALAALNTAVEALKCEAIFEAEDTYASNTGTWSEVTQYKGTGSTGHNKFSFAQATASSGQTVTFKLNVDKAGNYELYMTTKDNPDRAIFNVSVNGTLVGDPVDLYSSNSDGEFVEHKVGTAAFVAGENEVTLTLNGKNSGNTGKYYGGAFDYFRLVEVDEAATPVPEDVSFDLLALYNANSYTATGVTPEEITDHNINKQRLKLTGNAANNEIAFDLGNVTAGTYEVVLNSKYYKDYGTWSFKMAGNAIGGTIAFADAEKNGSYHDVSIGTIEHAGGKLDFTFVSVNGGTLVPVSVSLKVAQSGGAAADKTELQSAVTGAADYAEEDYTADSWSTFSAALTAAQSVLDDADASQSEIDEALSALNSAIAGLQKAPTGDGTGTVLYENKFETLPEELQDVSGWQLVKLLDGTYALQGTSTANAGLLAQFTGVTLPEQYTVVVDMTMLENQGSSGYSAGVTFQHTSSSAFYHYRLDNGTSDTAQLYQWNGSASKKAQGSSLTLTDGEAYRLRITVDGTTMTGYVDGNQVLTYSGAAAGGNVGLRVYSAAALFDNLVVYEGIIGPGVDESAPDMVIAGGEPVVWNNEDEGVYGENSGTWSDVTEVGQNGSAARSAEGGSATFSNYSPATGNFVVQWYVPVADGAETNITLQTLNGTWKFTVPAGTAAGWHTLGIVSGTENTAFTVNAESAGKIYADAVRLTPTTQAADEQYSPTGGGSTAIAVLVNQIGYDTGSSMRATVPNAVDGTKFQVVNAESGAVAYEGTVVSNIADFTAWSEAAGEYYITCAGAQSYNFSIGTNLIYRRSVENALKFMAETRSDNFCVGRAGIGWRDSHQFSFELNGLVLQYMANPSLYDNMDYEIYEVASCEYEELQVQDEPALIWLIQFAALRYYDLGANEGKNLHMLTKEQLAYYLYIYPEISEYVDEETYEKIRDYTISVWGNNSCNLEWYPVSGTNHDLYSVQTAFGGLKGSQPPGHSIVPNLLMYEVALRDGLGEDVAQKFFDAAYENCAYLISDDFDLNDPFYNKGQRMSEYITIPALAYFLEMYPGKAPSGLKAAIAEWAEVTIARSNNMWDIRMAVSMAAGDGQYYFHNPSLSGVALTQDYWTGAAYANADAQADYLSGGAPRNEPGNQAGLQAVTYAAARVLGSGETSDRLQALGVAAIDDLFGRNPSGRAAFYHFTRDFVGGDLGWYKQYAGGNGVLEGHTAVIDANAPEACYPYNPEAYNTGYTEGWVSYNTAWNASLAYSAAEAVALEVQKPDGGAKVGSELTIILRAPVNMDSSAAETAEVVVTTHTGEQIKVALTETGNSSQYFSGTYTLPDVPYVTVSYGSGLFKNSSKVTVEDFVGTPVTSITLNEAEAELGMGETYQISAVVAPDNASDKSLSYVSSNTSVATVSAGGIVTAVGIGEATITVTSDFTPTVSAQCKVTVSAAAPKSLTLDAPETLNVFTETGKAAVTAIVYSDGSTVTENLPEVTYATSNKRVLAVAADGTLTPVAAGTATITATATVDGKEISGTAEITVTAEISYDLLGLYKAGAYTADDGTTVTIAANTKDDLTGSYGLERVKLTGGAAGNEVSFLLDGLSAGEYQVTLYTKFYGGDWAYGIWSLMMDDQVLIENLDFDNEEKNGHYYNLDLGTVTLTDAAEHQFTFVSVDGGSVVPVSVTLTKCAVPDVAKIGDVTYGTLSEAIADADDGAEIVLLADTEEASVVLLKGNTLDLNGHTLTADKYVAIYGDSKNDVYNHVVDSVGGGLLKVGKDRILIHKGNKHLPIWDDVNKGYTFANLNGFDKKTDESAENSVRYTFLPYLDASAYALITQGAEVSGVEMKVKATWNKAGDGMPGEVNFVYTDDLMQRFYAGYDPETGKYGNAFTLTLSGTDSVDNLAFEVIFVSETGVTLSCK